MVLEWSIWLEKIPVITKSIKWLHNNLTLKHQKTTTFFLFLFFVLLLLSGGLIKSYYNKNSNLTTENANLARNWNNAKTLLENVNKSANPLDLIDSYFDVSKNSAGYKINRNYTLTFKIKPEEDLDASAVVWIEPQLEDTHNRPYAFIVGNNDAHFLFKRNELSEIKIYIVTGKDAGLYNVCLKIIDISKLRKNIVDREQIKCENLPVNE